MPIYQTAHYQVQPDAVEEIKHAIKDFVGYVAVNEPGSKPQELMPGTSGTA